MTRILSFALRGLVFLYRYSFAALFGGECRFAPSCSAYADEAIRIHGPFKGTVLTARRLCRCHPFGGAGFDPVPHKKNRLEAPLAGDLIGKAFPDTRDLIPVCSEPRSLTPNQS